MSSSPRARGYGLVVAAFAVAVAASALLAFGTMYASESQSASIGAAGEVTETSQVRHDTTLAQASGWGSVAVLVAPLLLLPGLALVVWRGTPALVVRAVGSFLLLGYAVLGIFSIGILVLPEALLMIAATALAAVKPGASVAA